MWIASAVNSYPAKAGEFSHGTYHPFAAQMGLGARRFASRNDKGCSNGFTGETRTVDVHIRTLREKLGAC
ncbi:MAG: helix-turn-helix domain-containing protein, partial [Clostridiales Family XIII bacterium]|nr:helix-turn-helix domain-containing protein [Clostridiales Family XIII bacterium]